MLTPSNLQVITMMPKTPADVFEALSLYGYIPDEGLATSVFLAMVLQRPLLLEGEAGVGKTEVAKVLSRWTGGELIRLQCYEGIDANQALYEWDYARQMLAIRATDGARATESGAVDFLFGPDFLVERPLLDAVRTGEQCVLLIDEVDRADDEFEAFLLELLSDFQITIPELGVIRAETRPIVILTSNRTRELHDALKRRCIYHWIGFPAADREVEIVRTRLPETSQAMASKVVAAVNRLRDMELAKPPGVAETLDWVAALDVVGSEALDPETAADTIGAVLKDRDDIDLVMDALDHVVGNG